MHARKLLARDTMATLESYCRAVGLSADRTEMMSRGAGRADGKGADASPGLQNARVAMREARLLAAELGLTPHRRATRGAEGESPMPAGTPIFSPDPALYPDPTGRADRICRFVRRLRLWEGDFAGQPFNLHGFQEAIVRRIYGPSTPDGGRLVRIACIWIPRGNAKTTLAAALGLAHFLGPGGGGRRPGRHGGGRSRERRHRLQLRRTVRAAG